MGCPDRAWVNLAQDSRSDGEKAIRSWFPSRKKPSLGATRRLGFPGQSLTVVLALLLPGLLVGCGLSSRTHLLLVKPAIEFTAVPVSGADDPAKLSSIKGRVAGARPGQQIVLYCRGEKTWWVQPFADHPFTKIQDDSEWSSTTHPGTEYAALLVDADFHPPATTDVLPTEGVLAVAITQGEVVYWRRWWFPPIVAVLGAGAIFGVHRLRLHQMGKKLSLRFEERLAERTRVAQELHDTLLQGVVSASMQLHVALDQLPEDSPTRPALNRILQLMGQVINEGRNTLSGLRSATDHAHDLKGSLLRLPHELGNPDGIDFRVVVQGTSVPLRSVIRDDVYSIGREALVNAFRHSGADNIDVELEYSQQLRLLVRDDGCGIDPGVLQTGRDGHWGLSGMRERAERIGAKLRVLSRTGGGTEVELRVPGEVAFDATPARPSTWLSVFYRKNGAKNEAAHQERVK